MLLISRSQRLLFFFRSAFKLRWVKQHFNYWGFIYQQLNFINGSSAFFHTCPAVKMLLHHLLSLDSDCLVGNIAVLKWLWNGKSGPRGLLVFLLQQCLGTVTAGRSYGSASCVDRSCEMPCQCHCRACPKESQSYRLTCIPNLETWARNELTDMKQSCRSHLKKSKKKKQYATERHIGYIGF